MKPPILFPSHRLLRFAGFFLSFACVFIAHAQSVRSGAIEGVVSNSASGAALQGAKVEIPALGVSGLTDEQGRYMLNNIPAGSHELRASYTDLTTHKQNIQIEAGETVFADIGLTSEVYILEKFVVAGEREGNAAAITRQRTADNVVNVVAMDAFGNVADGNIGNFMQKLPGVGTISSAGDIIGVNIRGLPSEMSSVTMDGTRMASAYAGSNAQGDRAIAINEIPSEFIKEIALNKVLTPDMSADAVGGSVNLVSKSAFDYKKPVFSYRAGANVNTYRIREWVPSGAITYMDKIGKKIGYALTASYSESLDSRDRTITRHVTGDAMVTQLQLLDDELPRKRGGVGLKLDFRPNRSTDIYINAQYNYFSYRSQRHSVTISPRNSRRVADYDQISYESIKNGAVPYTREGATAGIAPEFTEEYTEFLGPSVANNNPEGERHSRQYRISGGLTKRLPGSQTIWLKAGYNPTHYTEHYKGFTVRLRTGNDVTDPRVGIGIDTSGEYPYITQTYGPRVEAGTDTSLWDGTYFTQPEDMKEQMSNASLDYEKKFNFAHIPIVFKSGLSFRKQHRQNEINDREYLYIGPGGVSQFRIPHKNYSVLKGATNIMFDKYDWNAVRQTFYKQPEFFEEVLPEWDEDGEAPRQNNDLTEDVYGAYAMLTSQFGKLSIITGIRYEETRLAVSGMSFEVEADNTFSVKEKQSRESKYDNLHPNIILRYTPAANLVMRAAFTSAITRPAFADLYLTTRISPRSGVNGRITQSNPNLKPQFSYNYDVSIEYYFEPAGVLSAGYFYKDMSDFISRQISTIVGGEYDGWEYVTKTNLGTASVEGFELNYSQQLRFLPRPFDGLSAFSNYTHIKTSGDYGDGRGELVRFIPENFNVGLSYKWNRFEFRVSANYQSDYLVLYNDGDTMLNERLESAWTWDFNFQWRVTRTVKFYVDVNNAFNESPAKYYPNQNIQRTLETNSYGMRISVGVSGRF